MKCRPYWTEDPVGAAFHVFRASKRVGGKEKASARKQNPTLPLSGNRLEAPRHWGTGGQLHPNQRELIEQLVELYADVG
jgi:hypothetical protein